MDALRKTLAFLLVAVMLICTVPVVMDGSGDSFAAGEADGVLLYEVKPKGDFDGVSIYNYGSKTIDLDGYQVTDSLNGREGTLTIHNISLSPDSFVVLAQQDSDDDDFTKNRTVYVYGKNSADVTMTGDFNLANSGDQVYLKDPSGKVIDAVYYGNADIDAEYWTGNAVSLSGDFYIQRSTGFDTDSADDWFSHIPGWTNIDFDPNLKFNATVTPFLFPDSGGIPVYDAISQATKSVYIAIYIIESPNMYALLMDLIDKGVDVKLLVEGSPTGGISSTEVQKLKTISDYGADVRIIGPKDDNGDDRYNNVHAKYCIVDGDTVVLTSENWTQDNLNGSITPQNEIYSSGSNGNRGWGAVVESKPYADCMMNIFENDWSMDYGDVVEFDKLYPNTNPYRIGDYEPVESATFQSYETTVTPVMSPDSSYDAMEYYISNAKERIYVEQQSFSYSVLGDDSPMRIMAQRAAAGVESLFILSGGINSDDPEKVVDEINMSTEVSAAIMDKPYVHNKGIICDDFVWVDSINWTDSSFNHTRESGVVINSKAISDYFAAAFMRDFAKNYTYDGFSVDISGIKTSYASGQETTFQVNVSPDDDYTFKWDFGDGEVRQTDVPRVVYTPTDGAHVLKITVTNDEGKTVTVSQDYYVGDIQDSTDDPDHDSDSLGDLEDLLGDYWYILLPIIVIIAAILAAVKKMR